MADRVETTIARMTPTQQEKTVDTAHRIRAPVITIDSSEFFSRKEDLMLNIKIVTWSLAILTTFTFVFCVVFAMLTPSTLYMHGLLLQILPGFQWFSWWGFLVGLIESFLYGAYAGLVYVPIYNFLQRKWGKTQ
jgi:hypothetical protein